MQGKGINKANKEKREKPATKTFDNYEVEESLVVSPTNQDLVSTINPSVFETIEATKTTKRKNNNRNKSIDLLFQVSNKIILSLLRKRLST